ncbi:alpha-1,6-mannosylglycoprotein 6-beta-N-acetylglucosaminyltransferase B-like isoform X1, partial [Tachysurus ichikawai]
FGGVESRGVLRKISDMLEVIMKRMETLSRLENANDSRRLEELSSVISSQFHTVLAATRSISGCVITQSCSDKENSSGGEIDGTKEKGEKWKSDGAENQGTCETSTQSYYHHNALTFENKPVGFAFASV